jgi:ribonuclease-3
LLQEKVQASLKVTPVYKVLSSDGPDHKKVFVIGVYFGDKLIAQGSGQSKQDGEVDAAKKAWKLLIAAKPLV